jgi:hypothetical protein
LIYTKPVRTCKCVFKRIVLTFTFIAAPLAALALAAPLAALALATLTLALPAALFAAFTTPSCFYSIIYYLLSFTSYLCIFTKKTCALLCYAYATCYCNLYLELFAFATANKKEKEEENK